MLKARNMTKGEISAINDLIPTAEKIASKIVAEEIGTPWEWRKGKDGVNYKHYFFNEVFCREMDKLAIAKGLRVSLAERRMGA